jgi:hypothetical protein
MQPIIKHFRTVLFQSIELSCRPAPKRKGRVSRAATQRATPTIWAARAPALRVFLRSGFTVNVIIST